MINGDGNICLVISGNGGLLLFTKNPCKWNSPTRTHMIKQQISVIVFFLRCSAFNY